MRPIIVIAVALLGCSSAISAQLFQWSSLGIADEAVIPSDTTASMGCGELALEIEWSTTTDGGSFVAAGGADFVNYEADTFGSLTGGVLQTGFDNGNRDPDDIVTIDVHFNQGVDDLSFSILDIDSGSWDDGVEVFYNGANNARTGGFTTDVGSTYGVDNETYMHGYEGYGSGAANGSANGNLSVDFSGTSITSFGLRYFSTDDANTNPGAQVIGISDLSFNCDNPTAVLITDVRLDQENGQRWLQWDTAWHAATAGFFAYRWDSGTEEYVALNDRLISTIGQQDGGVFAALDDLGTGRKGGWYLIEEVRTDGASSFYGPFSVSVGAQEGEGRPSRRPTQLSGPGRIGKSWSATRAASPAQMRRLALAREEREAALGTTLVGAVALGGNTLRGGLRVDDERRKPRRLPLQLDVVPGQMVGVALADVAELWRLNLQGLTRVASRGRLLLSHRGEDVAWTLAGDRLVFFAQVEEPKFSATTEYWLSLGRGNLMTEVPSGAESTTPSVVRMVHKAEQDVRPMTGTPGANEEDLYSWSILVGGTAQARQNFAVDIDNRVPNTALEISIEMLGLATLPDGGLAKHTVSAYVDGTALGNVSWSGTRPTTETLGVVPGLLSATTIGSIELQAEAVVNASLQGVFIDSLTVGYQRYAIADQGFLAFEALVSGPTTIAAVSGSDTILLDVTDSLQPVRLRGTASSARGGGLSFEGVAGHRYVVAETSALSAPTAISQKKLLSDRATDFAEYVVVAPSHLVDGAKQLAAFRSEYSTLVVDVEALFDEYSYGAADPEAVRGFLQHMSERSGRAPRFLVLVGAASYDRKNITGSDSNVLPTFFRNTPHGIFSSDVMFGDLDGDRVPEVAVGRIPALSNVEITAYVAKLTSKSAPPGTFRGTLLADNNDSAGNFEEDSEALSKLFSRVAELGTNSLTGDAEGFRAQLESDFSQGLTWTNYFGHGGFDRFAQEGLLMVEDVGNLTGPFLPTITALSCQIGRFEFPQNLSLAEALVLADGAGALAVWAPSGLSQHAEADEIANAFVNAHAAGLEDFARMKMTMGEAVGLALRGYADGSPVEYMQLMYNLLGDPAVASPLTAAEIVADSGDNGELPGPSDPPESDF